MHAEMVEPIELPLGMISGLGPWSGVLDGRAHSRYLANTIKRLCTAAGVGQPPAVATRPVPKLLWAVFLYVKR